MQEPSFIYFSIEKKLVIKKNVRIINYSRGGVHVQRRGNFQTFSNATFNTPVNEESLKTGPLQLRVTTAFHWLILSSVLEGTMLGEGSKQWQCDHLNEKKVV